MPDQLDLFAATPPAAPDPPAAPTFIFPATNEAEKANAPSLARAGLGADSLAALAGILLLDELPPVVPGALPRVAVDRAGWDRAMDHRRSLVLRQMAGTITPGDAGALAALSHISLQQVDWSPTGPMIVTADGYEHLQDALAGLRLAARETADA